MPAFGNKLATTYKPSGPWTPPHAANLELWLPYNTDFNDASGNGRNSYTAAGTPQLVTDPDGTENVLYLNGSSRLHITANLTGLTGGQAASFCCWVRPVTYGDNSYGRIITQRYASSGDETPTIDVFFNNSDVSNGFSAAWYSDNSSQLNTGGVVGLNSWSFIGQTMESGNHIAYEAAVSRNTGLKAYTALNTNSNAPVVIGDRQNGTRTSRTYIRQIMWWKDVILSQQDMLDIMTNT